MSSARSDAVKRASEALSAWSDDLEALRSEATVAFGVQESDRTPEQAVIVDAWRLTMARYQQAVSDYVSSLASAP